MAGKDTGKDRFAHRSGRDMLQFREIGQSGYPVLLSYYQSLRRPLADLNAMMMLAWKRALDLRYCIDLDGVLYVTGTFDGLTWGWGPPIGENVRESHLRKLMGHLNRRNATGSPSVLYLWDDYSLLPLLRQSTEWRVLDQAAEYVYDTRAVADLPQEVLGSLRKEKERFIRRHNPALKAYTPSLRDQCLGVLNRWYEQKTVRVSHHYRAKFEMEASVCRHALESELPLSGVVVYVGGDAEAFSLGGKHSENCFNCMFEKTNLSIDGLATFVFSSLAEQISANYGEINAGEDWGVAYLKTAKEKWKPIRIQKSYMLRTQ